MGQYAKQARKLVAPVHHYSKTAWCKNMVHLERKVDDGGVLENAHKFIHI